MTIWQLALIAKEVDKLSDDGLVSITAIGRPEVQLTERAFMELFPACWYEEPMDDPQHKKRSIRIDGVEYATVMEVKNG